MKNINRILIKNYKCFRSGQPVGFELIKPINVLIGRNNSGKSSLLDILTLCTDIESFKANKNEFGEIIIGKKVNEREIERVFSTNTAGGDIHGNHYAFGSKFIGKNFDVKLGIKQISMIKNQPYEGLYSDTNDEFEQRYKKRWEELAKVIGNPLAQYEFLRISAERDIYPEKDNKDLPLQSNGDGATNIIHKFINHSSLDSKLVEVELLEKLNKIVYPDSEFTDIVVQQVEFGDGLFWEIFLEEKEKGRVALSKSGSGLKTIILVLINLLLMPKVLKKPVDQLIFGFEELENNLHPALQRKLFNFIQEWAVNNEVVIFITTHSNVAINMFSKNVNAQILHVLTNSVTSDIKVVNNYLDEIAILADLDVKASDILQSNGIIWVEGPSDRVYLNRWIELFSGGTLQEGLHYQVLFYGGRLLAHIGFDGISKLDKSTENSLINLLLTNRNVAVVIDSDKKSQNHKINDTKKRIKEEFENINAFCWITKGKEIENYIPQKAIETLMSKKTKSVFDKYQTIDDFLDKMKPGLGKQFLRNKVKFAIEIKDLINKEDLIKIYDFEECIQKFIVSIKKWNSIS